MTHPRPRDLALVVVGAVLWGTGGLTGAALDGHGLRPLTVATLRLGLGGLLLLAGLAAAGRLHRLRITRAVAARVLVTAVLAAVYQGVYFAAVRLGSVTSATLVALGAAPLLVVAVTAVRARRAPGGTTLLALALALGGLVLLLGAPRGGSTAGALLALVPAAAFATMTLVNRRPVDGLGPLELTGLSFTLGALLLAPVALALGGPWWPAADPAGGPLASPGGGVALLVWLGLGPTALAYGAYFAGLRTVPGPTATVVALLEPLTAAVGAAVLLGERLGPAGIVGGALLVAGIVVLRSAPTMAPGPRTPA